MRIIFAFSSTYFANFFICKIESRALSHGTLTSLAETRPSTSSPNNILRPVISENIIAMSLILIFSKLIVIGNTLFSLEASPTSI